MPAAGWSLLRAENELPVRTRFTLCLWGHLPSLSHEQEFCLSLIVPRSSFLLPRCFPSTVPRQENPITNPTGNGAGRPLGYLFLNTAVTPLCPSKVISLHGVGFLSLVGLKLQGCTRLNNGTTDSPFGHN